ncbi:MAG: BolA/IbaG family iron-sulfur metabolism protein [Bdellovibrionales bacterium]
MSPEQIRARLLENFPDSQVEVRDMTGTEDHYEVAVTSSRFAGLSRIDQHKVVMAAFDAELKTGEVHALTIRTKTP